MKKLNRVCFFVFLWVPCILLAQLQNDFSTVKKSMNLSLGNLNSNILPSQKSILDALIKETSLNINLFYSSDMSLNFISSELTRQGFTNILNAGKDRIKLIPVERNDISWARDFSPLVVPTGKSKKLVAFRYANNEKLGQDATEAIAKLEGIKEPIIWLDLFQENGNILIDDQGNLFLTEMLLLKNSALGKKILVNKNNIFYKLDSRKHITPKSKAQIEKMLKTALGAKEVIWLPIIEQEKTGHVDMIAKIVRPNQVIVAASKRKEMNATLNRVADEFKKHGYQVFRSFLAKEDQADFSSYTNSEIVGNVALIPQYGARLADNAAVELYKELGFKVFQIPGQSLAFGGSVHCLTFGY